MEDVEDLPKTEDLPTVEELPSTGDLPAAEVPDDFTNYIDGEMLVDEVVDDRTLMGTVFKFVFGDMDVMIFFVAAMIIVTLLIISADFMRWKGRE